MLMLLPVLNAAAHVLESTLTYAGILSEDSSLNSEEEGEGIFKVMSIEAVMSAVQTLQCVAMAIMMVFLHYATLSQIRECKLGVCITACDRCLDIRSLNRSSSSYLKVVGVAFSNSTLANQACPISACPYGKRARQKCRCWC